MKKTAPRVGLAEFAAGRRKSRTNTVCELCDLPERDEIDAALKGGITQASVLDWLKGVVGAKVTRFAVSRHFKHLEGEVRS